MAQRTAEEVAEKIRDEMSRRGVTVAQLAKLSKIAPRTLDRRLAGDGLTVTELFSIGAALRVHPAALLL